MDCFELIMNKSQVNECREAVIQRIYIFFEVRHCLDHFVWGWGHVSGVLNKSCTNPILIVPVFAGNNYGAAMLLNVLHQNFMSLFYQAGGNWQFIEPI